MTDPRLIRFAAHSKDDRSSYDLAPWEVLIVDDEPEVHEITQLVLRHFSYNGRPLRFHSAYSACEAELVLDDWPDAAVILLDVVMETDTAGLSFVDHVRQVVCNQHVQIILRTGQPGHAPEGRVVRDFAINSYTLKTDLTASRLTAAIETALQNYETAIKSSKRPSSSMPPAATEIATAVATSVGLGAGREEEADRGTMSGATMTPEALRLCRIDLSDLVHAAVDEVGAQMPVLQQVKIDLAAPSQLVGDREKLLRTLISLFDNAVSYTPAEAEIRICGQPEGESWYRLSVIDNGPGMADAIQRRVFASLSSHPDDANDAGGGLGLALAKQRIEKHGGTIQLVSAPKQGTAVHLLLPLVPPVSVHTD